MLSPDQWHGFIKLASHATAYCLGIAMAGVLLLTTNLLVVAAVIVLRIATPTERRLAADAAERLVGRVGRVRQALRSR